ncbi:hypothetical protein [Nocardia sp. NPDC057353]|uniref:hypothetical protein n=1 Tax=Nocardia sp. NPDC057353 TaxID=3346104 RepID=UPI0036426DD8
MRTGVVAFRGDLPDRRAVVRTGVDASRENMPDRRAVVRTGVVAFWDLADRQAS